MRRLVGGRSVRSELRTPNPLPLSAKGSTTKSRYRDASQSVLRGLVKAEIEKKAPEKI